MKYLSITCLLLSIGAYSYGQITSVNTACAGAPVSFSAPANETTYTWTMDTVDINQARGAFSTSGLTGYTKGTFASTNYDNGTWYTFINFHLTNTMLRLTYTGDPNGNFTTSTVGTFGSAGQLEGIDIVKDPATGNWYGLTANNTQLFLLSFGSSLANAPTTSTFNFSSGMSWPHQVGLAKYGSNWIAFIGDRNSTIKRVDFGSSLSNTPTMTSISNVGSVSQPCNFAIHKENGNWYMLVSSLIAGTITRYNFGSNISNNSPTGTLLGNPGSLLSIPRSVCIASDCNQVIAYILNEGSGLIKLDFGQSITNTPAASSTGSTGIVQQNSLNTYFADTVMYANIVSFGSVSLSRGKLMAFPKPDTTLYYNNTYSHSFATAGPKNVTLYLNQGSHMGSEAFCKSLTIVGGKVLRDTSFCSDDSVTLDASASGASAYSWSTGAHTPAITVYSAGKYWVTLTGSSCINSDTANVSVISRPLVFLGPDTGFCDTMHMLANQFSNAPGSSFVWSTGSTSATIPCTASGNYWLSVTHNGCTAYDTVSINVTNLTKVFLGNDTSICTNASATLYNHASYPPGASFLWSTGSIATTISVHPGTYWLSVQLNNCVTADTIIVLEKPLPAVSLGNDTGICTDRSITLTNHTSLPAGTSFLWSTGSTNTSITATPGTYWLTVKANGCEGADTINILQYPSPVVELGNDSFICPGQELTLYSNVQPAGVTYKWNKGSEADSITITKGGIYTLTVTDKGGCEGTDAIFIREYEYPFISLGEDKDLCTGESVHLPFEVRANRPYSIKWQDGTTDSTLQVTKTGTYIATITDVCGTVSDEVYVKFTLCKLFFPSAFSPNGDNTNDNARIKGDLAGISQYELSIFNRWGQRVYYTTDPNGGWDGAYKGKDSGIDTYFYMIQLTYRGEKSMMKGDLTLVR